MDSTTPRLVRALADRIEREDTLYRQKLTDIAATLDDVILMGLGDPDAPTPAHVKAAAIQAIEDNQTHYTPPAGRPALRTAIAAMLERDYGLDYTRDEIMVTAGTQEGVMLCALAFLNPGDEMMVPAPRFTSYDTAIALAGGKLVDIPTVEADDFAMNPDTIESLITDRTRVLVLITPGNPTGAVTPPDAIRRIAEICKAHDIIVISDEIYGEILFDGAEHLSIATLPGMRERTITMNGFSKSHSMTGWRIGYLAAPASVIGRLVEPRHALSINTSTISQHAALAAASGRHEAVTDIIDTYKARRAVLLPGLEKLGFSYVKGAGSFYVYTNISASGLAAPEFCERMLREARVMTSPGTLFADSDDRWVRFSLLQPIPRIKEALARIEEAKDRIFA